MTERAGGKDSAPDAARAWRGATSGAPADVLAPESPGSSSAYDWTHLPAHLGLSVSRGKVPDDLPGAQHPWPWLAVTPDAALLHWEDGAGVLVSHGREVVVQWDAEGETEADPSWVLQGWAVTLASLQRGAITMHAATVLIRDRLVAIAGEAGAGKTTTAMGLRRRGHQLLVDDVTLLEFRGDEAWTTPYARNVHLLPDTAEALGLDFSSLPKLAGGRDKAAFRTEEPPIEPHRIHHIVVLGLEEAGHGEPQKPVRLAPARGAQRLEALVQHTRREGLAPLILGESEYFRQLARLAGSAPVHVLGRPEVGDSLEAVLDAVEGLAGQSDDLESPPA